MNQLNYIISMSHNPEWLLEHLRFNLCNKEGLFRKLLIVPSLLMKQNLYKKLLKDKVVTGFKVLELPVAIDYLIRLVGFEDKKNHNVPAKLLLSMHLEVILAEMMEHQEAMQEESLKPLFTYLSDAHPHKMRGKIQDLSDALAREFMHYGLYGGKAFKKWFATKSWQVQLWDKLFSVWDYPYKLFGRGAISNPLQLEMEIHLFGFSYIPSIYEEFLHKLSPSFKFYEYYLNPCSHFWGDVCSEKERFFLNRRYAKQGVSQKELGELEGYLKGRNLLLANFGKQTQKRFNTLLDREYALIEPAELDQPVQEGPCTLLQAIKNDIVEWREEQQVTIKEGDDSVQIHEVSSKKREVEVLLAGLMDLTHRYEINPSDILVLAPNISEYFPFIYQVFHDKNPFAIEVHDLEIISQNPFLKGVWEIICLKEKRWEQKDIFKLLMIKPLLARYGWTEENVLQIKKWCEAAHIHWGFNRKHREEMLSLSETPVDLSEVGTWSYGFERLLFGLVSVREEGMVSADTARYYPMEEVEMLHAELLGEFIHFVQTLYADVMVFSKAQQSIIQWVEYFRALVDRYFLIDVVDSSSKQAFDFFVEQLKTLLQLSHKVGDSPYPFSSMKRFFQKAFCKKSAVFASANKEAICFASLLTQQIYPAKVIWLLGMEEGAFPRFFEKSPLQEIEVGEMDYFPSPIEEDRQTLLDVILYAQDFVRISYSSMDPKDGTGKNVSFLIAEILSFVEKFYPGVQNIKHIHKSYAFHKEEWMQKGSFLNFSQRAYQLAQSFYHTERKEQFFIPEFYKPEERALKRVKEDIRISLRELTLFARNPFQHYFNNTLGIYIKKEERDQDRAQREFVFSSLDRMRFGIKQLNHEFHGTYEELDLLGALPSGVFKEIARDQLEEETKDRLDAFKALAIDPSEMITIELSSSCQTPIQKNERWFLVPHLTVDLGEAGSIHIEGLLENVSKKGLAVYGTRCMQDYVKIWPIYLVFHQIVTRDLPGLIEPQLLFMKEGVMKSSPEGELQEYLKQYLLYYLKAQDLPSPLFPSWAEALLSKSTDEVHKMIGKSFASTTDLQKKFLDEYQKWSFEHLEPFCAHAVEAVWGDELRATFQPLILWQQGEERHA